MFQISAVQVSGTTSEGVEGVRELGVASEEAVGAESNNGEVGTDMRIENVGEGTAEARPARLNHLPADLGKLEKLTEALLQRRETTGSASL